MKVVVFNPYGNLQGENWKEYRSVMLAKALVKRGHNCIIYSPLVEHRTKQKRNIQELKFEASSFGYQQEFTKLYTKYKNHGLSRALHELLYSLQFIFWFFKNRKEVSHIVCVEPAPFASWVCHLLKKAFPIKLVYDVLDLFPEALSSTNVNLGTLNKCFSYLRKKRLSSSDLIVYCSKHFQDKLGIQNVPSKVVYLGITAEFEAELPSSLKVSIGSFVGEAKYKIVYAGSLGDSYGLDKFIDSMKIQLENLPQDCRSDIKVGIFGLGTKKQIELICSKIEGFEENFKYFGAVTPSLLKNIYSYFNFGLITYKKGNSVAMPVKVFDYIDNDLFIVTNSRSESSELIKEQGIGLLFDYDWRGICEELIKSNIVKLNFKHAKTLFDSSQMHDDYVKYLEEIRG